MVLLRTASGRLAHINNSRRASYGYDQRIEVHGAKGRLIAGNRTSTTVELADASAVKADKPLHFFLERYAEAYKHELDAFVAAVVRQSADASRRRQTGAWHWRLRKRQSYRLKEGRSVKVSEIRRARHDRT